MPSSKDCNWGGLINISSIVSFRPPRHFFLHIFWHFFVIILIVWQINKYKYKNWPQRKQVTKAQAGKGHPATRTITANRHTRKAFQWTWTMLMKTMPCQTMLRCPLSRKWSHQILSQTSPASNRTLASANLSLQPPRPLWLIWSTLQ